MHCLTLELIKKRRKSIILLWSKYHIILINNQFLDILHIIKIVDFVISIINLCSAERKIECYLLLPNSNKLTRPVLLHRPECTSRIHPLPNSLGANVCSVNFAIKDNPGKCDECKDGYYGKIAN